MIFQQLLLYVYIVIGFVSCNLSASKDSDLKSGRNTLFSESRETKTSEKSIPSKVYEIPLPEGFYREKVDSLSFEFFLRNLPLNTKDNTIYAYDGSTVSTGGYHYAIIKIDIGKQDLQQCADAVMRLRAEYLYERKLYNQIHFNFLSDGKPRYFSKYCNGNYAYKQFRKYLDHIFSYANTSSLCDELKSVRKVNEMKIGDVFIQKGSPVGHAVIVVDMAIDKETKRKIFLLAESYMPAQSIHILSNLNDKTIDPWYPLDFEDPLSIPTWTFYKENLKRF